MVTYACNHSSEKDPWGLLAKQSSQISDLRLQREIQSQKVTNNCGRHPTPTSSLHTCAVCTHSTRTHVCIYTHHSTHKYIILLSYVVLYTRAICVKSLPIDSSLNPVSEVIERGQMFLNRKLIH